PGENPEEVTAIAGSVTVDGEVSDNVVAVGGSCTINGRVGGSVTAVGGSVRLGPQAEVSGDVVSVGGEIDKDPGARVHGSTSEVSALGAFGAPDHGRRVWSVSPFAGVGRLMETLTKIVLLALLVCLVLLVARPTVERIALRVGAEPGRAGLTGFLCQLAFLPLLVVVTVLLVLTIVGCALLLLYPFAFIALLIAGLVGYAAVALRLGSWAEERLGWHYTSPYVMALAGVALIEFLPFIGRVLGLIPFFPLGAACRVAGFVVGYLAWTIGFGAVALDFLAAGGFRQWRRRPEPSPVLPAPAPAPPPPPAAPPPPPPPDDPWETR
ncbi:MAG TPA: polymer-forming cytoskeletal protein, partial [Thermoanaerobaculia bacterium]